jgi:beta-N-acetylhexosaminidase
MNYDISRLTIEEKIGQLLMFGIEGVDITDHAIHLIKELKVGNIILFARNAKDPKQLFTLNQSLQKLAHETLGIPMFISIDQEGGMVTRIFHGATFFPGAMTLSAAGSLDDAYKMGDFMGEELLALGVNMNLAPVLDVNNNPKNPVIGVRSYSDDPIRVADYGIQYIKGLQNHIFATGKHFPGHGDTHLDSHLALPSVDYPLERLEAIELVPFKRAIKEGIGALMSSHINFPAFTEEGRPTTLSKKCLTGFLRETLGFEGLIVTDGMEMKAIQDHYGTVEASLMSIQAGANLVCICHSEPLQIEAIQRIKHAIETNELPLDVLDERVKRVLDTKSKLKPIDLEKPYEAIKHHVENKEHQAFSYHIVKKALTLVKGEPLKLKASALFIGMLPKATTQADDTDGLYDIVAHIHKELPKLKTQRVPIIPSEDDISFVIEQAKDVDQIIMTSYNANIYPSQIKLIDELSKLGKDLHVIAMRNPFDLYYTEHIQNYVCLYEYTPNSIRVLLGYLKGDLRLEGRIPVHYEPLHSRH